MTNSPCLGCKEVMHYSEFEVMQDEENGLCTRCYNEELSEFVEEKNLHEEFVKLLNGKYNKNFEKQ